MIHCVQACIPCLFRIQRAHAPLTPDATQPLRDLHPACAPRAHLRLGRASHTPGASPTPKKAPPQVSSYAPHSLASSTRCSAGRATARWHLRNSSVLPAEPVGLVQADPRELQLDLDSKHRRVPQLAPLHVGFQECARHHARGPRGSLSPHRIGRIGCPSVEPRVDRTAATSDSLHIAGGWAACQVERPPPAWRLRLARPWVMRHGGSICCVLGPTLGKAACALRKLLEGTGMGGVPSCPLVWRVSFRRMPPCLWQCDSDRARAWLTLARLLGRVRGAAPVARAPIQRRALAVPVPSSDPKTGAEQAKLRPQRAAP